MTDRKYVKVEAGERIEKRDFDTVAQDTPRLGGQALGEGLLVGADRATGSTQAKNFVVSGFEPSSSSPNLIVTRNPNSGSGQGCLLVGARINGTVEYGFVLVGGDASKTISLASYGNGTYGIYVKMDLQATDTENRIFWNADAATPVEIAKNIPTRQVENWSLAVELASPGDEWVHLGDVVVSAGAITGLTDKRDLFFEGRVDLSYIPSNDWGDATDRSATRKDEGVFGLRRFTRAMQRQVELILGGSQKWWETPAYSLDSLNTSINTKITQDVGVTAWLNRPTLFWATVDTVTLGPCALLIKSELKKLTTSLTVDITADLITSGTGEAAETTQWYYVYLRSNGAGAPVARISAWAPNDAGHHPQAAPEPTYVSLDYLYVGSMYNDPDLRKFKRHGLDTEMISYPDGFFTPSSIPTYTARTALAYMVSPIARLAYVSFECNMTSTGSGNTSQEVIIQHESDPAQDIIAAHHENIASAGSENFKTKTAPYRVRLDGAQQFAIGQNISNTSTQQLKLHYHGYTEAV